MYGGMSEWVFFQNHLENVGTAVSPECVAPSDSFPVGVGFVLFLLRRLRAHVPLHVCF